MFTCIPRQVRAVVSLLLLTTVISAQKRVQPKGVPTAVATVYFDAAIEPMTGQTQPIPYTAIAVNTNGTIDALGSDAQLKLQYPAYKFVDMQGQTIFPGFIDSHSHTASVGMALLPQMVNLGNVNVTQQPGFTPMTSHQAVLTALGSAVQSPSQKVGGWVIGLNYEPARMTCAAGFGFVCPTLLGSSAANNNPIDILNSISSTVPIMVLSESGHTMYVNTPMLNTLNICISQNQSHCTTPTGINPSVQPTMLKLNSIGLLTEDMCLWAEAQLGAHMSKALGLKMIGVLESAMNFYASQGFTTVSEGAASQSAAEGYMAAFVDEKKRGIKWPATVEILLHDTDVSQAVSAAKQFMSTASTLDLTHDMTIAGVKIMVDGSNQGLTGFQSTPYKTLAYPYNSNLVPQPWLGYQLLSQNDVTAAAVLAHAGGYPLYVHANGDAGVQNTINGLGSAVSTLSAPDVVIHSPFLSSTLIQAAATNKIALTMLIGNTYFYGQPMCQQIFGNTKAANIYAVNDAIQGGVVVGLHSDAVVTPPSPLFSIWEAVTRSTDTSMVSATANCPVNMGPSEQITLQQAFQAYTSGAAQMYGITDRGTLQHGLRADFVVLSQDPLATGFQVNNLSQVSVIETVRDGVILPNTSSTVWPLPAASKGVPRPSTATKKTPASKK